MPAACARGTILFPAQLAEAAADVIHDPGALFHDGVRPVTPLPHHYKVRASGAAAGTLSLDSPGLQPLRSAAPAEFGGPGDLWSPETLLVGAVADCFILTFRAVARAGRLEWLALDCECEGTLERIDGVTSFTRYVTHARLRVAPGTDLAKARELLERAERGCLVANSLRGEQRLEAEVVEATA